MMKDQREHDEESMPLQHHLVSDSSSRNSTDSLSSDDSIMTVRVGANAQRGYGDRQENGQYGDLENDGSEIGDIVLPKSRGAKDGNKARLILWVIGIFCLGGWLVSFFLLLEQRRVDDAATVSTAAVHDPDSATGTTSYGKRITLTQVLSNFWNPESHSISWIAVPNGEDGLLLMKNERGGEGYLRVEDIRGRKGAEHANSTVLMNDSSISVDGNLVSPQGIWPSPDLKSVLIMSDKQKNWRHSFTGKYWLFDVASQTAQPLDPENPEMRIQLASWSPRSDAVVFTRGNNMYLRRLSSKEVAPITTDGGSDLFYGIPDWVYEEEVFAGNSVTWWSGDGKYIAFLRTNESVVPEYPVQYFMSKPSGKQPPPGLENYPEVRQIKYPKAGAPNPVVNLQFYGLDKGDVFSIDVSQGFADEDRLIIEVLWASQGKVLVRETNRESDLIRIVVIDVETKSGKVVRSEDIQSLDGGWVEPSQSTRYIPADPDNGRPHDGYIDTVIHNGYDHLAYFTPLDSSDPIYLTSGEWEVVGGASAVDLKKGLVYFVGTKESPTQRHVYRVKLDGTDFQSLTDTSKTAYYDVSFSAGAGYALLTYRGPGIPWQRVISTPSIEHSYDELIEDNKLLAEKVNDYALPAEIYQTVTIDGFELQVVERRPPHFNPSKEYPVLFHPYGGPGSQTVNRIFTVDFQSYVASALGYIVVTVDGRGTGYVGRKTRCIVRGNLGYYEARDQIETAKVWAQKKYVDSTRMAIWGWSYGGYLTLKTLEQDGGQTFRYGMAVAPVTDWQFYDSIYTERYMHTPQHNEAGYANASISNMTALQHNVRFLFVHGVADDNVHMQNSLALIDKLDQANVENYDVHVFPDSDHTIRFHNALKMVHDRLSSWLVNAFNGEWYRISNPDPRRLARRLFQR
ncbi:Dipeptidyl peptidase IV (DPP IV) N-terminal region domain containing protein [Elaphomyces granulatus]